MRDNKGKVALKGDTTIVIGTEAKNVDLLSADTAGSGGGTVVRRTSGDSSLALPPAYSNVSSRRPSMETRKLIARICFPRVLSAYFVLPFH